MQRTGVVDDGRAVQDGVGVQRIPLRREAMVGSGKGRRVTTHQCARDAELLVGVVVGGADVLLADRDAIRLGRVAADHVGELGRRVVARVRVAVGVGRAHEPHELVRDLVGERITDHRELGIGLQCPEDVVDDLEAVGPLEIATLLDVRVLVDHACFLGREVCGCPRQQVVGDVLLEAVLASSTGRQAVADGTALRDGASEGRVIQLELAGVRSQVDQLDVVTDRLAGREKPRTIRPLAPVSLTGRKSPTARSTDGACPVFPTGLTMAWS